MANDSEKSDIDFYEVSDMDYISFDELEAKLQADLDENISELEFLKEDRERIGNPENLGTTVMNVVWEQFTNQIATTAGEDFIKGNRGLTLDLRDDAHIQTSENFSEGKISIHNHKSAEDLEKNYDRFKNLSHKEFRKKHVDPGMNDTLKRAGELHKEGVETVTDIYTGQQIPTKTKDENGNNNPNAAQREHVTSSAENYKNPTLQMSYNNEELAGIINDPDNLQGYTTAEKNIRKSDKSANEMQSQDKNKHWEEADKKSKEHINNKQKEGEERLKKEGKETQKEEAFRITGDALRTVAMQLLAELLKEVIRKTISWLTSGKKSLESLIESIKSAISTFTGKIKTHLVNAGEGLITTVATAILGPIVRTIKKAWSMLKQGWKSLKEAIAYIKNPENKNKPFGILILEVGKIVTVGLSAAGAVVLGEVIEKGLMSIPIFAFEIPLLGSLASLIGLFMGGLVAGIIGAIALNLIDKAVAKRQTIEAVKKDIEKGNEVLGKQNMIMLMNADNVALAKNRSIDTISNRHKEASATVRDAIENIFHEESGVVVSGNEDKFDGLLYNLEKISE